MSMVLNTVLAVAPDQRSLPSRKGRICCAARLRSTHSGLRRSATPTVKGMSMYVLWFIKSYITEFVDEAILIQPNSQDHKRCMFACCTPKRIRKTLKKWRQAMKCVIEKRRRAPRAAHWAAYCGGTLQETGNAAKPRGSSWSFYH